MSVQLLEDSTIDTLTSWVKENSIYIDHIKRNFNPNYDIFNPQTFGQKILELNIKTYNKLYPKERKKSSQEKYTFTQDDIHFTNKFQLIKRLHNIICNSDYNENDITFKILKELFHYISFHCIIEELPEYKVVSYD